MLTHRNDRIFVRLEKGSFVTFLIIVSALLIGVEPHRLPRPWPWQYFTKHFQHLLPWFAVSISIFLTDLRINNLHRYELYEFLLL